MNISETLKMALSTIKSTTKRKEDGTTTDLLRERAVYQRALIREAKGNPEGARKLHGGGRRI